MDPRTEFDTPDLKELADSQLLPVRSPVSRVRGVLRTLIRGPEFLAVLTVVLVLLTWKLIVATDKLDEHTISLTQAVNAESKTISKEEAIVHQEMVDSPPQIDLVAQVTAPLAAGSAGQISFRNQGSSYVSVAYAWCWGDDNLSFDVNKVGYVQDPALLRSMLVHNMSSVVFAACSGKVGNDFTAQKPRYIYTFAAYTTPSGSCRNRQQWFALDAGRSTYQSEEDLRSQFPANLNQVARIRILRAMTRATETGLKLGWDCLSPGKEL